jgi:ABC-2 type transport system permease protein
VIRPAKVRIIASWELSSVVRRVPYLVFTFVMPLFFTLLFGGVGALQGQAMQSHTETPALFGIVDQSGALHLDQPARQQAPSSRTAKLLHRAGLAATGALEQGQVVFVPFASGSAARDKLRAGKLRGYFVFEPDWLESGKVKAVRAEDGPLDGIGRASTERALGALARRQLLTGQVKGPLLSRALDPVRAERRTLPSTTGVERQAANDSEMSARLLVPLILALLLMMSLVSTSSYLVQGVAVEKENKVVEVLLASASADEIMAGKLIGLGAAGLLQVGVWSTTAIAAAGPLFLLGYLFIGSLMLATGSFGSNARESQQFGMLLALPAMVPVMLMTVLLSDPHGTLARVLSWIPFTAPITIVTRLSIDPGGMPGWQLAGSLAVMLVSIVAAIAIGARLFRVGLLLTGSRPRLGEILRQARVGR